MGKKYLIDSNVLIEFLSLALTSEGQNFVSKIVDEELNISFISKIEVLGHPSANERTRAFVNLANVLSISDGIIEKTIDLRLVKKIKIPDALIAATAVLHNLVLVTRNTKDFKNIQELTVVNPHGAL